MDNSMKRLVPGQELETTIVAITKECIFLDLSSKSEGVLDAAEMVAKDGNMTVKEGDKIKVFFMGEKGGEMKFTTRISGDKADKSMIENAYKNNIPVEGVVEKEIKGGFEVKIGGTRAFCPFSQMGFKEKKEPAFYVGKHLTFKIQEYKENGRNILVSNKAIEMEAYEAQKEGLKDTIKVGMVVKGTIESLQSYGAFVNINGFRALLPISEVGLTRIDDISKVLSVGQEVEAEIIKVDWNTERVSLSLKSLIASPWDGIENKYPLGSKQKGTISRIADFGLFITLEPGIDGLLHASEIEDVDRNINLKKVFSTGKEMTVIIKSIDSEAKRLSLTTATTKEEDTSAADFLNSKDNNNGDTYNPFAALLKKK